MTGCQQPNLLAKQMLASAAKLFDPNPVSESLLEIL
jgi:hypothetical protein